MCPFRALLANLSKKKERDETQKYSSSDIDKLKPASKELTNQNFEMILYESSPIIFKMMVELKTDRLILVALFQK
jgi:hypothetical protein